VFRDSCLFKSSIKFSFSIQSRFKSDSRVFIFSSRFLRSDERLSNFCYKSYISEPDYDVS